MDSRITFMGFMCGLHVYAAGTMLFHINPTIMKNIKQSTADLIQGIEMLLSQKDRYPFTTEDEVLLRSAITELKRKDAASKTSDVFNTICKLTCWLVRICGRSNLFENFD